MEVELKQQEITVQHNKNRSLERMSALLQQLLL